MMLLGILVALFAVGMLLVHPHLVKEDEIKKVDNGYGQMVDKVFRRKSHPLLLMFSRKVSILTLLLGLFIAIAPYLFFFADRGKSYLLVYPNGKTGAVLEPGFKLRMGAKIDPWDKWIDVKVDSIETEIEGIEGIMKPIGLRFSDQVTADGYLSLRFEIPNTDSTFIDMALKYRTMQNLLNNTIIPSCREELRNVAYMYAAQDYISGEAQSFRQTYEEALKYGTFEVKKVPITDTTWDGTLDQRGKDRAIKEIKTGWKVVKVEDIKTLQPKRIMHELITNHITVSQVIIDDVDLEPEFKERLKKQRDESAKRQLEQQMAKTAIDAQLRYVAEGERDKAKEKAKQEVQQVQELTAEETKLKKAKTTRDLATIALETERINSTKKKVAADAQYYENAKLVQAGLTPQERAEWDFKTSVGVAAEIAKLRLPSTAIIGGNDAKGGNGGLLESLIGAEIAKGMLPAKNGK